MKKLFLSHSFHLNLNLNSTTTSSEMMADSSSLAGHSFSSANGSSNGPLMADCFVLFAAPFLSFQASSSFTFSLSIQWALSGLVLMEFEACGSNTDPLKAHDCVNSLQNQRISPLDNRQSAAMLVMINWPQMESLRESFRQPLEQSQPPSPIGG